MGLVCPYVLVVCSFGFFSMVGTLLEGSGLRFRPHPAPHFVLRLFNKLRLFGCSLRFVRKEEGRHLEPASPARIIGVIAEHPKLFHIHRIHFFFRWVIMYVHPASILNFFSPLRVAQVLLPCQFRFVDI
jgi:hypothetical protein